MSESNGGSAFPFVWTAHLPEQKEASMVEQGMSLRDWFAGQAVSGVMAKDFDMHDGWQQRYAVCAYSIADAMLAERQKNTE